MYIVFFSDAVFGQKRKSRSLGVDKELESVLFKSDSPKQKEMNLLPDFGLFEASHMACPVLPQYHPKQLMELLNSGKIRWVKAILAHLVRCLGGGSGSRHKTSTGGSFNDDSDRRSPR